MISEETMAVELGRRDLEIIALREALRAAQEALGGVNGHGNQAEASEAVTEAARASEGGSGGL